VLLDASLSTDSDGRVVEFYYDFGDGAELCWTLADIVSHTYSAPGQYFVRCKVKDEDGAQSPWTKGTLVEVKAKKASAAPSRAFLPGMDGALTAAGMAMALLLVAVIRRNLGPRQ